MQRKRNQAPPGSFSTIRVPPVVNKDFAQGEYLSFHKRAVDTLVGLWRHPNHMGELPPHKRELVRNWHVGHRYLLKQLKKCKDRTRETDLFANERVYRRNLRRGHRLLAQGVLSTRTVYFALSR